MLRDLQQDLIRRRIGLVLVHTESSLRADLRRHRLSDVIGTDHIFDTLHEALAALLSVEANGSSAVSNSTPTRNAARFKVDDQVRVRDMPYMFYTRTQMFTRGVVGTIASLTYKDLIPEEEAFILCFPPVQRWKCSAAREAVAHCGKTRFPRWIRIGHAITRRKRLPRLVLIAYNLQ